MVFITKVMLREQVGVLCQSGTDLLLFFETTRVRHLHVAAFGRRFIHYFLQTCIKLAVYRV